MTPNEPHMPDVPDPNHYTAPLADDAPTRPSRGLSAARQSDGAASLSSAISSSPSSVSSAVKVRGPSPFSPRLGLLAALLYNPVVLVVYLLYLYGPVNTCVAGSLCSFGSYPAVVQALLILAGSATLWLLLYALVLRAIEAPGRKTGLVRLLRDLARYERIRELLLVYGALLALLLMVALVTRRLTMPSFIVGAFGLFVCLYCANSTPAETPAPRD
jgi:hypothetical protein